MSGDNLTYKTQKKDPFTSLHKKENLPHWAELEILRNGALIGSHRALWFAWAVLYLIDLHPSY